MKRKKKYTHHVHKQNLMSRNLNPVKKGKIEEERTENKGWEGYEI